jgi:hypothetical protein
MINRTMILTAAYFLFFTNNGFSQWEQTASVGYPYPQVSALVVSGKNIFASFYSWVGVYYSTNNGSQWTEYNSGMANRNVEFLVVNENKIIAGNSWAGYGIYADYVFISTLYGAWKAIDSGLPINANVTGLGINGGNIFVSTISEYGSTYRAPGVFVTMNNGVSWTEVDSGLPTNAAVVAFITSGNNIFAGTNASGVFLSTNNGLSWSETGLKNRIVHSLAVCDTNIFASTQDSGVFLSTNNGTTWTAIDSGLPEIKTNIYITSFATSGNSIFAGTDGRGVFLSTNNGALWTPVNYGLKDSVISALAINSNYLFAGTASSADTTSNVWRRPISDIVHVLPKNQQAFPNQTSLRISFSRSLRSNVILNFTIQSSCFVQLGIYAVSGKRIAVIEQGERTPGKYFVGFESRTIPAGLYLCRFQAGSYIESNRIMIVK